MKSGKLSIYLRYLIICVILVLVMWLSSFQVYQAPKERFKIKQTKTHLLILTSWRSGSSFVGQLFNQNPDVFYLMEPAWHVWTRLPKEPPKLLHLPVRDLIRSIFLCDMSAFPPYMSQSKYISDIFMWQESRALCSYPACPNSPLTDFFNRSECHTRCRNVPLDKMEEACRAYSHVVVKTVRFFNLEVLYPLLKDPSLNLKIIHLVRDPRAVFSSREAFPYLEYDDATVSKAQNSKANISVVMEEICKAQVQIYKLASQNPQPFLKNRYLMVRYEDLVRNPVDHIREMYDFVGLSMSPKLESWFYNITHGLIPKEKKFLPFSEDSKKIAQHWREKLHFSKVKEVQKLCQQEMEVFGYQLVESEREQKNMLLDLLLTKLDKFEWIH
ncbi:carbohydrate sulfotransferase 6-like [Microcaecilia unicolor]|uniref:Sulfotransferase n=1 Tax=Microcaecilia unicolor TaxID=1415580 RepID=A0A6P7X6J5_9AMPH|nr:carbohydrate sulfotransferase 6-like [Microcaecilia unicolor]